MKIIKSIPFAQIDAIIDSIFDPIWICDRDGRIVHINKVAERLHNIKAEYVLNKKIDKEFIKKGIWDVSLTLEVLKKKASVTMVQEFKDGRQVLAAANPVFDEKGNIAFVITNSRDITELNYLRSELEKDRSLSNENCKDISTRTIQDNQEVEMVARSKSMQQTINIALRAANVDSTVLIEGESGVGKGLLANFIHKKSRRRKGPFIRVDCTAIPETLIESELFGYDKGAFTGASASGKCGLFELANNGTLFLDEVGEISLKIQVKLLRFLEEKEFFPVGGTIRKKLNVRVIAATNLIVQDLVKKSKFREDLFYRLNVIPIKIPPLRDRVDDIPYLLYYYLNKFNEKHSMKKFFRPIVIDNICRYHFPGNIRELINIIERMVVLSTRECIDVEMLPSQVLDANIYQTEKPSNLSDAVLMFEKEIIHKALQSYGSQRKAAKALGIDQSTLSRKCKKYDLKFDAKLQKHD